MKYQIGSVFIGLTLLSVVGCGGYANRAERVATVPVNGTLTYKGQPLEFYQVTFFPPDGQRVAVGVTDAQGKFKLGTNEGEDGSPEGLSKVAVSFVGPPNIAEAGVEQIVDDPSKLPKPKIKIPSKYGNPETSELTQEVPPGGLKDLLLNLQ